MADKYQLTEGSLLRIMKEETVTDPIMQVLGSKHIASASADKERYRLLLSDGKNLISFAMLTTQINDKVVNGELADNTIIKVKRYITSKINNAGKGNRRVLVVLDMEILVPGNQIGRIGNPEPLSDVEVSTDNSTSGHFEPQSNSYTAPPQARPVPSSFRQTNVDLNASLQDQLTHPISSLSPYQNKWVIKARVVNKSNIREWSNSRGEGKLFNMELMDESGEIRCTAFKDLVDKFYDMIQIDKVYYISKAQLKIANKQFNNLKNDYEMTFTNDTIVQECHDADIAIPQTKYDFMSIDQIAIVDVGTIIDVIGICKTTSDMMTFTAKSTGRELKKREITLVDQSNCGITVTLWGKEAETFEGSSQPVIVIKGAKVGEFGGGKNLTIFSNSILKINPDIPESHRLKGWFDNGGMQQNVSNISAKTGAVGGPQTQWLSFKEVQELVTKGNPEKGDYFLTVATILLFRSENCLYKSCPVEDCKKKVVDQDNGMYKCEKCQQTYPTFKYRFMGYMNMADWSGNQWMSTFGAETEKILGKTADELGAEVEADLSKLSETADKANFHKFMIKCRAKVETWSDEQRLRTVAMKVEEVNYKEYNAHLISRINQLLGQ